MPTEKAIQVALSNLLKKGLIEIADFDTDGEPMYQLTVPGREQALAIQEDRHVG